MLLFHLLLHLFYCLDLSIILLDHLLLVALDMVLVLLGNLKILVIQTFLYFTLNFIDFLNFYEIKLLDELDGQLKLFNTFFLFFVPMVHLQVLLFEL